MTNQTSATFEEDDQGQSEQGNDEEAEEASEHSGEEEDAEINDDYDDDDKEHEEDQEQSEDEKVFSDNYEEIRISKTKENNSYSNGPSSYVGKVPQVNSNEPSSQSKQQIRNSRVIPFVCDSE